MTKGPVLIEIDEDDSVGPDIAPPVPDESLPDMASGHAMQRVTGLLARRPSRITRIFWSIAALLFGTVFSIAAWDYATSLIARVPVLGYAVVGLGTILFFILAIVAVRELSMIARLKRLDDIQAKAAAALSSNDVADARDVVSDLKRLYRGRADVKWGRDRLAEREAEQFDADALIELAEKELLSPLDQAAMMEIEAAARQVATVTALVPLALADVVAALTANLRMVRRVAMIYGGRSGVLGNWRLARAVMAHLVATGAVAVGDDLLSSVAGGGLLSKLSRRFGEGMVNGALTARVGVAAIEVCRPLPFRAIQRPSVTALVGRALTGIFASSDR